MYVYECPSIVNSPQVYDLSPLQIHGSVKTCNKLSKVELISNQVHVEDVIVLLNQSLFNKLMLKC